MTKKYLNDINRVWYKAINVRQRNSNFGVIKKGQQQQPVFHSDYDEAGSPSSFTGTNSSARMNENNQKFYFKKPFTFPAIYRVEPIMASPTPASTPGSNTNKPSTTTEATKQFKNKKYNNQRPYVVSSVIDISSSSPLLNDPKSGLFIFSSSSLNNASSSTTTNSINGDAVDIPAPRIIEFIRGAEITNDLRLLMSIHSYINSKKLTWTTELYAALMQAYSRFFSHSAVKKLTEKMKKDGIIMGMTHFKALLFSFQKENNTYAVRLATKIGEILKYSACEDEVYKLLARNAVKVQNHDLLKNHVQNPITKHFGFRKEYFQETFEELGLKMNWIPCPIEAVSSSSATSISLIATGHQTFSKMMNDSNYLNQVMNYSTVPSLLPKELGKPGMGELASNVLLIDNPLDQRGMTPGCFTHLIDAYADLGLIKEAESILAIYLIERKNLQQAMYILDNLRKHKRLDIIESPIEIKRKVVLPPISKRSLANLFHAYGKSMMNPKQLFEKIVLSSACLDDHFAPLVYKFKKEREAKLGSLNEKVTDTTSYGEKRKTNVLTTVFHQKAKLDSIWLPGDSIDPNCFSGMKPYTVKVWAHVGKRGYLKPFYEEFMKGWQLAVKFISHQENEPISSSSSSRNQKKEVVEVMEEEENRINVYDPTLELSEMEKNAILEKVNNVSKNKDAGTQLEESSSLMNMENILLELKEIEAHVLSEYMKEKGLNIDTTKLN